MTIPQKLKSDRSGSVVVEFGLLAPIVIGVMIAIVEMSVFVWQWNALQRATRTAARIASLSDPITDQLAALANSGTVGNTVDNYSISCNGATLTCSEGSFDTAALNRILNGGDGQCATQTEAHKRGLCDMIPGLTAANIEIEYAASLNEVSGAPGGLQPIITVRVKNAPISYTPLSAFGGVLTAMPTTSATVLAQDLSGGGS